MADYNYNNNQGNRPYSYAPQPQPQYPQQAVYTQPVAAPAKSGINMPTVIISILAAAAIGLTSGFAGTKIGNSGSGSNASGTAVSYVQQAIDRTSNESSQSAYSVADVAAAVADTVVEITTEVVTSNGFMGQYVSQGAGSGVIFTDDGYIMTNHHVIDGARSITVRLRNGQEYSATLVGDDSLHDLALIKVDATGLHAATMHPDSDQLRVGQTAIAIGNPLGQLGGTVTSGIVSALGREIEIDGQTMTLLQTSAAINPGNSGGGLFDDSGNLIGIVNAKSSGSGIEGLGFAIPVNTVRQVYQDFQNNKGGSVSTQQTGRASLGIVAKYIDPLYAWMYNLDEEGVYIIQIQSGSSAEAAGLKEWDRIISFNGVNIDSEETLIQEVAKCNSGDTVEMIIKRDGQKYQATVTLG